MGLNDFRNGDSTSSLLRERASLPLGSMKFSRPKMPSLSSRPRPQSGKVKYIKNSAVKGGKYIIASRLMGAGAKRVSKLINHAAQPSVYDVDEYIIVNQLVAINS